MIEKNWTKGDWGVKSAGLNYLEIYSKIDDDNYEFIEDIDPNQDINIYKEYRANKYLMASSPKLYEKLEDMMKVLSASIFGIPAEEVMKMKIEIFNLLKEARGENEKDLSTDIIFKKYFEEVRSEFKTDLESLDDETTRFKASLIKARCDFKQVKDEELQTFYNIWENFDIEIQKLRDKVAEVKEIMNPVKKEIEEINKVLTEIDIWRMNGVVDVVEKFRNLYGTEKKIMEFLINNYKNENL